MIARYSTAIGTGTFVTFALLYVMQLLIALQPGATSDPRPRISYVWGTRVPDTPPPVQNPPPIDKEKLTNANPTPPQARPGEHTLGVYLRPENPTPVPDPFVDGGPIIQDGPLVEVMLVQPDYPIAAQRQGLEGYVIVEFDVLASGSVANVTVIESSDRVFENAAIKAAKRFRFKAQVVDGVPRVTTGIRKLFRFDMND